MWPFKSKEPIRCESPELSAFESALTAVRQLIADLDGGEQMSDEMIRNVYFGLSTRMQSNCYDVASGLLATIGAICAHAEHLTHEFLPSAMRPIYHLGIEDFDGVRAYILHVANAKSTCLGTQTTMGRRFLERVGDNRSLIVESFQKMYDDDDKNCRNEEADVPDKPPILMG